MSAESSPKADASGRSLEQLVADLERLEAITEGWSENQRATLSAVRSTLEAIQAEAFRRIIRAVKARPEGMAGLREAVDDPWVFNVLHYHGLLAAPGPSLVERVEAALASVRPMLAQHDGDVELVGVEGDTAKVRLVGSCDGCAFQDATLRDGVEAAVLAAVPEITKVRLVVAEAPKLVRLEGRARMGSGSGSGAVIEASPFSRPWIDAGAAEAVREGEVVAVELDAASVLLTRHRGEIKAFPNACTHLGMPLEGGYVEDGVLTCPYHGFRYRLDSGECLTAPDVALVCYPARVEGERVQVQVLT